MTTFLRDLDVAEVSLVPKGANRKKFLLLKEEVSDMPEMDVLQAVLDTPLEEEASIEEVLKAAALSDKAAGAVKGALRMLNAYKDEIPKDLLQTLAGLVGYGYPAPAETEKEDDMPEKTQKTVIKEDGSIDFEAVPEEVRPAIEMLWKDREEMIAKAAELEKALKEERDRQLTKEFIAKAAEFHGLPVKAEEFGPVLKQLADAAPEAYAQLEEVLKAADEAAIQAKLLEELGSSGPSPSSALGKLEALAKSLVEKEEGLTPAQAWDRVVRDNPALYTEYQAEMRAKR